MSLIPRGNPQQLCTVDLAGGSRQVVYFIVVIVFSHCFFESPEVRFSETVTAKSGSMGSGLFNIHFMKEEYLQWVRNKTRNPRTAERYELWVRRFLLFTQKSVEDITLEDVMRYNQIIRIKYAPKNCEYAETIIKNFLNYCSQLGKIKIPLGLLKIRRQRAKSHPVISKDEYLKLLTAFHVNYPIGLQRSVIFRLLYDTGMRVGELVSLDIGDISHCKALVNTEKTLNQRHVYWTEETDRQFRRYIDLRIGIDRDSAAVFVGLEFERSNRMTSREVQRQMKIALKKLNLNTDLSPHSFRHGFVHRMALSKVSDSVIAELVGHTNTVSISNYTRLSRLETEGVYRSVVRHRSVW